MTVTTAPDRPDAAREAAPGVRRSRAEAVNDAEQRQLYKKREPIYPKLVHGKFRSAKWAFMLAALGLYYAVPFIRWDRGPAAPDQAVLIDFAGRRFYFFFIEIWPQEVYFVTALLIIAALALFLVTALFGRVWCGYACPQTVWTDLFIAVERIFEGDRNARIRLDRASWSTEKAARKTGKHAVWLLIAAATGGAWILYFHDAFDLIGNFFTGEAQLSSYLFFGLLTFTTYTLAGTMREQVCTYMCPWPRIQAALTDEEALNVTYRVDRGEPRGAHKKGASWEGRGDCIDCKACVAACPMGIDIRNGPQLECIHCALCIDACDEIMGKVGRPLGLIAYDTEDNIERRLRGEPSRFRFVRPRTIFYAVALVAVTAITLFALLTRATMDVTAQRDRNPNYVRLSSGDIRNGYTIKAVNKLHEARDYWLEIQSVEPVTTSVLGQDDMVLSVGPDSTRDFRIFVTLSRGEIDSASEPLVFRIEDPSTGEESVTRSVFITGGGS